MFNATNSNAINSKSNINFSFFFSAFPESTWNFEYFDIKDEPERLFVSEIRDYKMRGYLNARKAAHQNTYGQSTC